MISNKIDNSLVGNVQIPGDKSISHRSIIIPSISNGICRISNLLESEDVLCTINERINKANAATIIEGPDAVLNSSELNKPIITEAIPAKIE